MAKLLTLKGKTSKLQRVFIQDSSSTVGAGLTGLVFNSASLTAYYIREGDASATAITLVTMTVGTWASGGFKEVDATNMPGVYEIGIPDAALASGADSVTVYLKGATNMAPVVAEIQLTTLDPNTVMRGTDSAALASAVAALNDLSAAQVNTEVDTAIADAALATAANLATVDANVDSILVDTGTTIPATITTLQTGVNKVLAFLGENIVFNSPTYDSNNNLLTVTIRLYDTKTNADTDDGSTGILAIYSLVATYNASSELQTYKVTLNP